MWKVVVSNLCWWICQLSCWSSQTLFTQCPLGAMPQLSLGYLGLSTIALPSSCSWSSWRQTLKTSCVIICPKSKNRELLKEFAIITLQPFTDRCSLPRRNWCGKCRHFPSTIILFLKKTNGGKWYFDHNLRIVVSIPTYLFRNKKSKTNAASNSQYG